MHCAFGSILGNVALAYRTHLNIVAGQVQLSMATCSHSPNPIQLSKFRIRIQQACSVEMSLCHSHDMKSLLPTSRTSGHQQMSHANALTSYSFFQDMIYFNVCISLHTLHNGNTEMLWSASYKKDQFPLRWKGSRFSTTKVRLNRKVKKKVWHGWGVSLSQLIAHSPSHLSLWKKNKK